jgi:hypothetical protein
MPLGSRPESSRGNSITSRVKTSLHGRVHRMTWWNVAILSSTFWESPRTKRVMDVCHGFFLPLVTQMLDWVLVWESMPWIACVPWA